MSAMPEEPVVLRESPAIPEVVAEFCRRMFAGEADAANDLISHHPVTYTAMFDEVDEGTAMFQIAATSDDVPVGFEVVTMDADGQCLPRDWYLTLAGAASEMLRGEIALTGKVPVTAPVCR